jgi:hypothetical protein
MEQGATEGRGFDVTEGQPGAAALCKHTDSDMRPIFTNFRQFESVTCPIRRIHYLGSLHKVPASTPTENSNDE